MTITNHQRLQACLISLDDTCYVTGLQQGRNSVPEGIRVPFSIEENSNDRQQQHGCLSLSLSKYFQFSSTRLTTEWTGSLWSLPTETLSSVFICQAWFDVTWKIVFHVKIFEWLPCEMYLCWQYREVERWNFCRLFTWLWILFKSSIYGNFFKIGGKTTFQHFLIKNWQKPHVIISNVAVISWMDTRGHKFAGCIQETDGGIAPAAQSPPLPATGRQRQ